jgi:hypothetical protein
VALILVVAGLGLFLFGSSSLWSEWTFNSSAVKVTAIVVDAHGNVPAPSPTTAGSPGAATPKGAPRSQSAPQPPAVFNSKYVFELNGVKYTGKMRNSANVGSTVEVEFRRNAPSDNRQAGKRSVLRNTAFSGGGLLLWVFGAVLLSRKPDVLIA